MTTKSEERSLNAMLGDRYRIVSVISENGSGSIYAADDLESGQRVAVKILHACWAADHEVLARFRSEARAATALGHPGIVQVLDTGALHDGSIVVAMELLCGEDLARRLKRSGAFRVGEACELIVHVCDTLSAAHRNGIVHGGLKPRSIFLPAGERAQPAKVLDFANSSFEANAGGATFMTATGTVVEMPLYMSPEQLQGKGSVDPRSDVYSLGVILFELLTDQHPFEDDSYPMLALKILTEPSPSVRHYRMDVPSELDGLIARMLSKQPPDRPPTCDAVLQALLPFVRLVAEPTWREPDPVSRRGVAKVSALPPPSASLSVMYSAMDRGTETPSVAATIGSPRATGLPPSPARHPQQPKGTNDAVLAPFTPRLLTPGTQGCVYLYITLDDQVSAAASDAKRHLGKRGKATPPIRLPPLNDGERVVVSCSCHLVSFEVPAPMEWVPPYVRFVVPLVPSPRITPGLHHVLVTVSRVKGKKQTVIAQGGFPLRFSRSPLARKGFWRGALVASTALAAVGCGFVLEGMQPWASATATAVGAGGAAGLLRVSPGSRAVTAHAGFGHALSDISDQSRPSRRGAPRNVDEHVARVETLATKVLRLSTADARLAVQVARQCAEAISEHIWEETYPNRTGPGPFATTLKELASSGALPKIVALPFGTVQVYGNYASHPNDDGLMAPHESRVAITALRQVLEWYFHDYLGARMPTALATL